MLKSMTGFARKDGSLGALTWHWEVRTVNGRGLDVRVRLPSGMEALEARVRDACKRDFARGSCTANLVVQRQNGEAELRLNEAALTQVAAAMARARDMVDAAPPRLDGLLAIRGVLEYAEPEDEADLVAERADAVLRDLDEALGQVRAARAAEGEHLTHAIAELLDEIERLVHEGERSPGRAPEAVRERLRESLARLLAEAPSLDEQRLHQEAVLLATRADIHEEIDRLKAHVAAARTLLAADEPVGRRLEFLAQEFHREANTICSKSSDADLTRTGLALKAVIDRLREQVQNIE